MAVISYWGSPKTISESVKSFLPRLFYQPGIPMACPRFWSRAHGRLSAKGFMPGERPRGESQTSHQLRQLPSPYRKRWGPIRGADLTWERTSHAEHVPTWQRYPSISRRAGQDIGSSYRRSH